MLFRSFESQLQIFCLRHGYHYSLGEVKGSVNPRTRTASRIEYMPPPSLTWTETGYPATIEFSAEVLEALRRRSLQGLLALPKTGLGLGGVLLGSRKPGAGIVSVQDFIEFPSAHVGGPSFNLTPDEKSRAASLLRETRALGVVGWYFSRTQPPIAPRAAELDMFDAFCPAPWQIMLVIRPGHTETTRALVFFRDGTGQVIQGSTHDVLEWVEPLDLAFVSPTAPKPVIASPTPTPVPTPALRKVNPGPQTLMAPLQTTVPLTAPTAAVGAVPAARPSGDEESADANGFQSIRSYKLMDRAVQSSAENTGEGATSSPNSPARADSANPSRRKWMVMGGAGAVGLAVVAAGANFLLSPTLKLELSESGGHITAVWNTDGVSKGDSGSLMILDGGQTTTIPLNSAKVIAGVAGFEPKSGKLQVTLRIGEKIARANWDAPENWVPNEPQSPKPKP